MKFQKAKSHQSSMCVFKDTPPGNILVHFQFDIFGFLPPASNGDAAPEKRIQHTTPHRPANYEAKIVFTSTTPLLTTPQANHGPSSNQHEKVKSPPDTRPHLVILGLSPPDPPGSAHQRNQGRTFVLPVTQEHNFYGMAQGVTTHPDNVAPVGYAGGSSVIFCIAVL